MLKILTRAILKMIFLLVAPSAFQNEYDDEVDRRIMEQTEAAQAAEVEEDEPLQNSLKPTKMKLQTPPNLQERITGRRFSEN